MKKIVLGIMFICILFLGFGINTNIKAADNDTIYVSSNGNDSNSGTSGAPVKTINRALELASDSKKIIQILDDVYILDSSNADKPLVINKNVTIKGDSSLPTIISRAGGIILAANVTFKDVRIGTGSYLRPGIAANGHTLRLENVHNDSTLRPLQIYGGTFIDFTTSEDYGSAVRGSESYIYITGGSYEAIYAGSANGTINIPVNITIDKGNGFSCNGVYAASTLKNPGDTATSGKSPVINKSVDVTSAIKIAVNNNASLGIVDGIKSNRNISLTVQNVGSTSYQVNYIDNISVVGGNFVIKEGSTFGNVSGDRPNITLMGSSSNKATLDISEVVSASDEINVNNFQGSANGIFIVNRDYILNILGNLSGTGTEFRTGGGMPWNSNSIPGYSGWIEYDTRYIYTKGGNGSFVISNPYPNQEDIKFTSASNATNGFITVEGEGFMPPELISFKPISQTVSEEDVNKVVGGVGLVNINVEVVYSEEEIFTDLSFVPFYYTISYKDKKGNITEYKKQESVCNYDGYYKCNYTYSTADSYSSQVMMKLEPAGSTINISKGSKDIKAGTYTISLTATTTSGVVTKSFTLTVQGDDEEANGGTSSATSSSSSSGSGSTSSSSSSNSSNSSNSSESTSGFGGSGASSSTTGTTTSTKPSNSNNASNGGTTSDKNTNKKPSTTPVDKEDNSSESQTTTVIHGSGTDSNLGISAEDELGSQEEITTDKIATDEIATEEIITDEMDSDKLIEDEVSGDENVSFEGNSSEKSEGTGLNGKNDKETSSKLIIYALVAVVLGGIITGVILYIKRMKKPCQ